MRGVVDWVLIRLSSAALTRAGLEAFVGLVRLRPRSMG